MAEYVVACAKADADGYGPELVETEQQAEVIPGKHQPAVHHEQRPDVLPEACLDLPLVWLSDVKLNAPPAPEHRQPCSLRGTSRPAPGGLRLAGEACMPIVAP